MNPTNFSLVPCDEAGAPSRPVAALPPALVENCRATADLLRRVGFVPPWIGYVALIGDRAVGGGAFVGPPRDGRVEIAYFTLEDEQGRGYASSTAAKLVEIARANDPAIGLRAFTLREQNPSTKILRKLGFSVVGTAHDADAGDVWEWHG